MKKLWQVACAFGVFFFANLGIAPNPHIHFNSPSAADVCDCGSICIMHLSCDVPKCNGRLAQQGESQDSSDSSSDD
jgi:hypothetical protein